VTAKTTSEDHPKTVVHQIVATILQSRAVYATTAGPPQPSPHCNAEVKKEEHLKHPQSDVSGNLVPQQKQDSTTNLKQSSCIQIIAVHRPTRAEESSNT